MFGLEKRARKKMVDSILDNGYFDSKNFYISKITERIQDMNEEVKKIELVKEISRIKVKIASKNLPHLSIIVAVAIGTVGAAAISVINDDTSYLLFIVLFMLIGFGYIIAKDMFEGEESLIYLEALESVYENIKLLDLKGKGGDNLKNEDSEIIAAVNVLYKVNGNKDVVDLAELREKAVKDEIRRLQGAKAEGKEKGRREGKVELLIMQLTKKIKSLPDELIDKIMKLPVDILELIATDIFDIESLDDLKRYL